MSARHRQISWAAAVVATWAAFLAAFAEAARLRASLRELVIIGVFALLFAPGSLALLLWRWPKQEPAQVRRPAMVSGRPIGEGWAPSVPRLPEPESMLEQLRRAEDRVRRMFPTQVLPKVVDARAAVAVAEPETEPEGVTYVGGYVAGVAGEPTERREDDEMRGWVAGAMDLERGLDEDEEPD